ncbi:MAG: dienelactone hydrolase family protein [Terricaulis sp.]
MRLDTPFGNIEPSRRTIAASLFFAGYAAAALSAKADPIHTPEEGLVIEDVHVQGAANYSLPAYVARPRAEGRHPAVIVVNEIFGIHDYIKDICRRLAHAGYVAIAPDYFDRAGDPAPLTDMNAVMQIVRTATYEQVMLDTQGAIAWLKQQGFCKGSAIGITGYCWGGAVVWLAAARFHDIKAGVAWYGHITGPDTPSPNDPRRPWPIDIAAGLHTPVLGLYGALDQGISQESIERMRAGLNTHGNPSHSEIVVYPDAQHGFHADYRASYNQHDAEDGWTRLLAWFRAHGVA